MKTVTEILGLEVEITNVEMLRASGYGQYKITTEFNVVDENGKEHSLTATAHSTDSQLWDEDDRDSEMVYLRAKTSINSSIEAAIEKNI